MNDGMEAGRELDMLVSKEIMGANYPRLTQETIETFGYERSYDGGGWNINVPDYSTDISAAWEVVEKCSHMSMEKTVHDDGGITFYCEVSINNCMIQWADADTAPLAICRAALAAIRAQEGKVTG